MIVTILPEWMFPESPPPANVTVNPAPPVGTAQPDELPALPPPPTQTKAIVTPPSLTKPLAPVASVKPAPPVQAKTTRPATPQEVALPLAGTTSSAQALNQIILGGSHHRPLMSYGGASDDQNCFWATGDIARSGKSVSGGLAEIGLCKDFADGALRAGIGIGTVQQTQNLHNGGSSKLTGNHLVGELNYKTPSGLLLSTVGVFADWDADLRRSYAGIPETGNSMGMTGIRSNSLRLRADWIDAWNIGKAGLTPYAAVTTSRTRTGGYTETGGSAPATFDGQKYSTTETRLGIASTFALIGSSTLRASLEAAHRLNGNGPTVSGQVPGRFAFSETVSSRNRSWMRAGLDLDMPLSRTVLLSVSLHAATRGDEQRLAGSASLRASF